MPDQTKIDYYHRADRIFVQTSQIVDCWQTTTAVTPSECNRGEQLK